MQPQVFVNADESLFRMWFHPSLQKGKLVGVLTFAAVAITVFLSYRSWKLAETQGVALLPRIGKVADFVLTDQDGHSIGIGELRGKFWVAGFICTQCPGPYAVMSGRFAELDRNFAGSDMLRLVSFTLDSEHDTPSILKRYAQHYEASARWRFLTGDKKQIDNLTVTGFRAETEAPGGEAVHLSTTTFALVDGEGVIRAYYDGSSAEVVQRILTDLGSLLRVSKK